MSPVIFCAANKAVLRMSTKMAGKGGTIVNVSSAASRLGSAGEYIDYAATKGAIDTLTIGLSLEVADEGIRVNCVRPGLIYTDMHSDGGEAGRVDRLKGNLPMKRGGKAEEVAASIAWLASDESSYTTGVFIEVSGGRWFFNQDYLKKYTPYFNPFWGVFCVLGLFRQFYVFLIKYVVFTDFRQF